MPPEPALPDPIDDTADRQLIWIALANLATTRKDDAPDCERVALSSGCSPRLFDTLTAAFTTSAAITRSR